MADMHVSLYVMLGIVEALFVALALTAVLFVQLRGARRRVARMQEKLRQAETSGRREAPLPSAPPPPEAAAPQRDYADFLRNELAQSDLLLGDDTQSQAVGATASANSGDEAALMRQMLAARHQFLQLELDVRGVKSTADAEAQRRSLTMGMQALLEGLHRAETEVPDGAAPAQPEDSSARAVRSEVRRLEDQILHLRNVIDNQHDVMRELRQLLEDHSDDSEELQETLRKLGDAEAQALELQRCLEVMDHENERLKAVPRRGPAAPAGSPDADTLRDLVGSQQRTISKLQHMLQSLAPDSGRAKELGDAVGKIQRANSELNSCVMVLEDENAMLRGRVETLQERLADMEAHASPHHGELQQAAPTDPLDDIDKIFEDATGTDPVAAVSTESAEQASPVAAAGGEEMPMDTDELLAELFGGAREDSSKADKPG